MVYIIPKAGMHPVERLALYGGLVLAGVAAIATAYLTGDAPLTVGVYGLAGSLAAALNPAAGLEYRVEPGGLRIGRLALPFAEMTDVRVARLDGTVVYAGLTLPGFWWGRAWSHRLGRFVMRGSTGLGQGVLIAMADGRRVMITPVHPVSVVVQLQLTMKAARAGARPCKRSLGK